MPNNKELGYDPNFMDDQNWTRIVSAGEKTMRSLGVRVPNETTPAPKKRSTAAREVADIIDKIIASNPEAAELLKQARRKNGV